MTGRIVPIAAAAVLTGTTTAGLIFAGRKMLMRSPAAIVPGYPEVVARAPVRGMWAFFPQLALAAFLLIVLLSPAGLEPQLMAILGAGAGYVLFGSWLAAESAPWAYSCRRFDKEAEVAKALGGAVRRVWVAPYPMVTGPTGTVATIAGRSLFIWNPLTRLKPEEIAAAAAFRAARRRAWPLGIVAVWATRLLEGIKQLQIARWPMWALIAISLVAAASSDGRWLRQRRRFATDKDTASAAITGILAAGREQARLSATGAVSTEATVRLPSVAELIWHRAIVQASEVGRAAGLDQSVLDEAVHEVVGREGLMPAAPHPAAAPTA